MEIGAQVLMKATKVGGIYSADPETHPDAEHYEQITYQKVLERGLKVMDATAVATCMDNNLPILIFNLRDSGNIIRAVKGEPIGSLITG
jgi:uridylate kinase